MANTERLFIVLNDMFNPPKIFTENRISFSVPEVTTENDRNTKVTVTGIPGKGYYGDVDVYFNRLDLAEFVSSFDFRSVTEMTQENIIQGLAASTGLQVSPDDFVSFTPPVLGDGEAQTIHVTAAATSLQWVGEMDINLSFGPSWLDSQVANRDLSIYKHPNAINRQSARLWTWGLDFSGIQAQLKPDAKGTYTDFDTVSSVCSALGMPDWVKGKVVDKATADVPDANPAFQRVVIQSSVQSGVMTGALYFHYNPA